MKNYQCPNCGKGIGLTANTVQRRWHVRGYKYEEWIYYVKCPHCRKMHDVSWKSLPFKVKLHFLFGKR